MSRLVKVALIDRSPWADLFEHPEEHIARLAEDIAERGIQTPLHVYPRDKRYELLTGHDRLDAAIRCGLAEVPVDVRTTLTDEDDRFAYFAKDNNLRKSGDKRRVAEHAIKAHPDWSDRRIAQWIGLSHPYIGTIRADLTAAGVVETVSTRVGVDGVAQPAHKPKPAPSLPSRRKDGTLNPLDAMRQMREAQAAGTAAFPEPGPVAGHIEPAPPYAFLRRWSEREHDAALARVEALPEDERDAAAALLDQKGVPEPHGLEILENLAAMDTEERAEIYRLHQSRDPQDRSLALTKAAKMPPMPDPDLATVRNLIRDIERMSARRAEAQVKAALDRARESLTEALTLLESENERHRQAV